MAITEDQTYNDDPKKGASILAPSNSVAITADPSIKDNNKKNFTEVFCIPQK
jgi:hypothetical protein